MDSNYKTWPTAQYSSSATRIFSLLVTALIVGNAIQDRVGQMTYLNVEMWQARRA